MKTTQLELDAAKIVLGLLLSTDLPDAAVRALEVGCDSTSLRILAGLTVADADEAKVMFDRVLVELDVSWPAKRDAAVLLARELAKEILNGTTAPYAGAKQIWKLSLRTADGHVPELDPFIYAASAWEERPEDRVAFEDGITAAAREFVDTR